MTNTSPAELVAIRIAAMVAVLVVAAVFSQATTSVTAAGPFNPADPPGWTRVDTDEFSVALPPCWRFVPLQGIDSFVGRLVGDGIELSFDYGAYSGRPGGDRGQHVMTVEAIDSSAAEIYVPCDPNGVIGLYLEIPVDGWLLAKMNLRGQCVPLERQADILTIFRSLRFG